MFGTYPHHGVFHKKKNKIRVVFDANAEYKGVSLNQNLLQGPDLTNELLGVLLRFRKERIAVSCDVEQMFHQFHVCPEDRDFFRFLWLENGLYEQPVEYRMCVHLFGATSSPGCANYGLKAVADIGAQEYSEEAAEFIKHNFYVDDGIVSVP